ncbi:MAG: hypothetical protein HY077_02555 [Elusimicrobia bacterium]|nr:hypothetical protein [Elusimicrobiota bacterium]
MEKRIVSAAVLLSALLAIGLTPRTKTLCDGFLPPNTMRIPVGDVRAKGIDQATFLEVMDKAEAVYAPIIAAHGGHLVVNRLWDDPTVNASAQQSGSDWIINMYGGLARHPAVTRDGMMLVACHELGHHLGGFPLYGGMNWASNEGASDYFANLKCLRLTLGKDAPSNTDPVGKAGCAAAYPAGPDRNQCEAGTMAGASVSALLAELGGSPQPKLDTPDPSTVDSTDDSHPAAQCRLDTYFQGSMCGKPTSQDVSRTDPTGGCTKAQGFKVGMRPRCWYAPAAGAESADPLVASKPVLSESAAKTVSARLEALRSALSGHEL